MSMKPTTIAALVLGLTATSAMATPPPPPGFYGFFRQAQINCPTAGAAQAVFDAMRQATGDVIDAATAGAAANHCDIGYVPGPVAVGESSLLGTVMVGDDHGGAGSVTFYSVHVGTSDKEWWVLYADVGGDVSGESK